MHLKSLVPIVLLVLTVTLTTPVQAASSDAEPATSLSRAAKLVSTLAALCDLDQLFAASEKGPGMDPAGEPNPQLITTSDSDDGEKGPGMDPHGQPNDSRTTTRDEGEKGPGMDPIG